MIIRKVPILKINPAVYNPRKNLQPQDSEYKKLKGSIDEFGYIEPLVWNSQTGNLVGGHQRFKILLEQGLKEIEVSVVNLSLEREKALNLALNKIVGSWDYQKLTVLLDELSKVPDFNIETTGFSAPELSQIFDRHLKHKDDNFDFEGTVKEIVKAETKLGDVIELGPHRLCCGDSASPDNLKLLMNNEKAAMLFTDPPYGISYYQGDRPNMSFRPKKCRKWETIYQDDLSEEEYQKWLEKVFKNMGNFLLSGAPIYVFNAHKQFSGMYGTLRKLKYHISTVIVWAKPNFSISYGDYNQQVEFCLYGWKENNGRIRP